MIIVGILAAIAIPSFLSQRAKAGETTAKADAEHIAQEVVGYYTGETGGLTLSPGPTTGTWKLDSAVVPVAAGRLSAGNSLGNRAITDDSHFCVAVVPAQSGARPWRASNDGILLGDCP